MERGKEAEGGKAKLETLADAIGKWTLIITAIVVVIIAIAVATIHYAFHVSVYPFWIAAGFIYVALGCFNYGFASRLLLIEFPPIGRYIIPGSMEKTIAKSSRIARGQKIAWHCDPFSTL
jgi:hypothetical protein